VAAAVASEGDGDGEPDARADGDAEVERELVGVGLGDGLVDGVDVGPPAIAGVARNDATMATASNGGASKRCSSNFSPKSLPESPQRPDTSPLSERASPG